MMQRSPFWLMSVLLLASGLSHAEDRLYGEVHLGAAAVSHSELDFYPGFGSLTLGAFVLPNIGLEVFADSGFRTDAEGPFELELDEAVGAAVRFQSPPDNGLSGYIVLGYVDFTVEQEENVARGQRSVDADFTGARVSVGVMQRLRRLPDLLVSVEYRNYYVEEDVRVDGLVLGLRVNRP